MGLRSIADSRQKSWQIWIASRAHRIEIDEAKESTGAQDISLDKPQELHQ